MLENYIKNNIEIAIKMQLEIVSDIEIVNKIESNTLDKKIVKSWMRDYGLLRGISSQNIESIVNTYLNTYKIIKDGNCDLKENYRHLYNAFYKSTPRGWLSATSKLLWCIFPNDVVIYDSFVERTIIILQKLENDLLDIKNLGSKPNSKNEEEMINYYFRYYTLINKLYIKYLSIIEAGSNSYKKKYNIEYPYKIRIIDKLLWMLGNQKEY